MNQIMILLPPVTFFFLMLVRSSTSVDTIAVYQNITDGDTIVSENEIFEMGFFSPGNAGNRYLGIWLKNTAPNTVVWVANRETPISNTLGMVTLDRHGILSLANDDGTVIWSSNSSSASDTNIVNNPVAQLLDTGNLVIKDGTSAGKETFIWQSFDYPGNIFECAGDEFRMFSSMKLPDTQNAEFYGNMSLQKCEVACINNCSCTAFANPNNTQGGVGCLQWFGDLIDVWIYQQNGKDLYVRRSASNSELSGFHSSSNRKKQVIIRVILPISAGLVVLGLILALYIRSKKGSDAERRVEAVKVLIKDHHSSSKEGSIELPMFSLSMISRATNKFSIVNKLGEGGFGPVYKGVLEKGQEIAIKRLSKSSRQGLDEFKNEVICIAKLQHRNLVKLLGYCIQGDETMLIYEYMPNKSLDRFIFDDSRKSLLDWPCRLNIIHGISGGLLYLHQDSRLRVVHRDLKAGNILLDNDMNPKISDFGLARMFKGHESEANTKKVVGTLGYISPEYAVNGLFSVKSDIFSFGVLVLEIVSGKKVTGFVHEDHHDHLIGHAWRLYKEGNSLDLIDTSLGKSWSGSEVLRSIHIALLCVQQRAEDRPDIRSVVCMLGSEGLLPSPQEPGFFIQGNKSSPVSILPSPPSVNEVTLSQIDGR